MITRKFGGDLSVFVRDLLTDQDSNNLLKIILQLVKEI